MEVILHIGAHCTDEDRIVSNLLRNSDLLAKHGSFAPSPFDYRNFLRQTLVNVARSGVTPEDRQNVLHEVVGERTPERLILSNQNFICQPQRIFEGGEFYRNAETRLRDMGDLFGDNKTQLFMSIRNPATFLSSVYSNIEGRTFEDFMGGVDPKGILWSDLIRRIRTAVPQLPITV